MALIKCKECGGEVSTKAKSCPKCGAVVPPQGCMAAAAILAGGLIILVVLFIVFGNTDPATNQNDAVAQENIDKSVDAVKECNFDEMLKVGILQIPATEEVKICKTVGTTLGKTPPINILRMTLKATFVLQSLGDQDSPSDIAYQLMNIVEARGSPKPERISGTLDVVCKIYNGTQGHVTPKDIVILLRNSGPMAHTISDDGLIPLATVLWEEKKDHGE